MMPRIVQVETIDHRMVTIHDGFNGTVELEVQQVEPKPGGLSIVMSGHLVFTSDAWSGVLKAIKDFEKG